MEDKHIGSVISAETNDGSVYQGKLTTLDTHNGNITMANVIKDGLPLNRCITLTSTDISRLKVIRAAVQASPQVQAPQPAIIAPKKQQKTSKKSAEPNHSSASAASSTASSVPGCLSNHRQPILPPKCKGRSPKKRPSGNPVLDALNHYKGIGRRNKNNLDEPIDFDLDSDFDFAENLKLFAKDVDDDEYYENVEKLKVSQNFAHYENIIDDEDRVTSWTNLKARSSLVKGESQKTEKKGHFRVTAVSFEKSMNGDPIPAINPNEKKEYLNECKSTLGEAVYDTIVADRVFQWVSEIQMVHGDSFGTMVLLASASNSVRSIRRLLTHFDKRRYNCHLFGKYPGEHFDNVNVVDDVKLLPRNVPIICILSPEINDDIECWLRAQSSGSSTHYVCIESVPTILEPSQCHLLQFGCATNGLRHAERKVQAVSRGGITFEKLCQGRTHEETSSVLVDSAIADLGSPANWFDDLSSKFIATAFATTFLIRLSQSN
ncbi:CBN-EDC-3 protein [Caenorhabditis brenneri]|uniref:CBN-EDC-3 protein n=1 Tax=Caenorhabditis brenneri TaxID=135651 RepID=G0NK75_CAEBE|nr:CBN-EDC-3 protein [Caenorhabditis brenneri]